MLCEKSMQHFEAYRHRGSFFKAVSPPSGDDQDVVTISRFNDTFGKACVPSVDWIEGPGIVPYRLSMERVAETV
jgi:hypothetical protein